LQWAWQVSFKGKQKIQIECLCRYNFDERGNENVTLILVFGKSVVNVGDGCTYLRIMSSGRRLC